MNTIFTSILPWFVCFSIGGVAKQNPQAPGALPVPACCVCCPPECCPPECCSQNAAPVAPANAACCGGAPAPAPAAKKPAPGSCCGG